VSTLRRVTSACRVGVYVDYRFRRSEAGLTTERAFALFVFGLLPYVGSLTLVGRLDPSPDPYPYALPPSVRFVGLPFYESLADVFGVVRALGGGLRRAWRALDDVDVLWSLGPNPMSIAIAVMGLVRGRRVVLGVRQDSRSYVRSRHPDRRALWAAAGLMHRAFRLLARRCPVAVVGPVLAEQFAGSRDVMPFVVSLVPDAAVIDGVGEGRRFGRRIVTVGRLDAEKNPLLLAETMAELAADDGEPWRLDVYGSGPLEAELAGELERRGLGDTVRLCGYVAADAGLEEAYRGADAFLHVSFTEGVPQVLIESFAAGLPTVATAVGGVASLAEDAALLIPPGDARAAADALRMLDADAELRARLVAAGVSVARAHTLEAEAKRVAAFLCSEGV
jgi:glycosyltransferase involved in cell wall biosynthesis